MDHLCGNCTQCSVHFLCCASIWAMIMIALDRYNVIVKGLSAKPMTNKTAMLRILFIWTFSLTWIIAPFFGWNRYVPEDNMTACGTDYLSKDWTSRSYILVYSVFIYFASLLTIIYSYFFIVQAVTAHEKQMREQAKKMNDNIALVFGLDTVLGHQLLRDLRDIQDQSSLHNLGMSFRQGY